MEHTLAPWTGDSFAMAAAAETAPVVAPTSSRTRRWALQVGRGGIALSSTVELHGAPVAAPANDRRGGVALTATAAVVGGLALLMLGASAGRAWSPAPVRAEAAMMVPAAKPVVASVATARMMPQRRAAIGHATPTTIPEASAGASPYAPGMSRAEAIERALGTGEFQEWAARDGTTGFAVAGPAETGPQGNCRALAVLTRKIDGSDSVASSRECRAATAKD